MVQNQKIANRQTKKSSGTTTDQGSQDISSKELSAPKAPKPAKTSRSTSVLDRMGGLGTVAAISILALIGTSGLIILIQSVLQQRREEEGLS